MKWKRRRATRTRTVCMSERIIVVQFFRLLFVRLRAAVKRDIIESRTRALCDHRRGLGFELLFMLCNYSEWRNENVNNSNCFEAFFRPILLAFRRFSRGSENRLSPQSATLYRQTSSLIGKCVVFAVVYRRLLPR